MRSTLVVLCLSLAAGSIPSLNADVRPRTGWLRLQSPNFLLLGDVGAHDLRQVAERLEQFREALGLILPNAILTTPTPTIVVVFKTHKSYEPLKPLYQGKARSDVAGFFQPGQGVNYVTVTVEGGLDNLGIIYHEYVHLLVNNNVSGLPLWFNEGLAEYYRTFQVNDWGDLAHIGRVQNDHVLLLRQQFLPLKTIIAVDHQSPLYNESNKASIFYAESWALVHYLMLGDERRFAKNYGAFVAALADGQSLEDAARSALGIGADELEKGLRLHIGREVHQSLQLKYSDNIAKIAAIQPTPVTEADVHATLGDVFLQMDRKEDAKAELAAALALDDGHGPAHASLGMLDLRDRRWEASRPHFERAVASPSANFLCHYYYGLALSQSGRETGSPNTDDLTAMERAFRRSIELNPGFADAYAELAWAISRALDRTKEAAQLMLEALKLAPGREDYLLGLGLMLSNVQDFVGAKQVLAPLATRAADEKVRDQARQRLAEMSRYEKERAEQEARARIIIDRPGDPASAASAPSAGSPTMVFKLRDPKPGETRYSGRLTAIECGRNGIVLVVKVDAETVRARAAKFDAVEFITYREQTQGRVGCGPRKLPDNVLLTLRLDPDTRTRGVAVAVEFVPDEYEPYQ
jgi:tetratricopeptide (TPR) repeat protein